MKALSDQYGFIDVGVARARKLAEEETHLSEWLKKGYHGSMSYMQNHFEKRLDPTLLVPGAKSVICFLYNYFPEKIQNPNAPKIAKYAFGEDYHKVIKDKLFALVKELEVVAGKFNGRIFVDSAPVMERQWAVLSGLGWIGKNSLLLRKSHGSFFFICSIICDLELEPDHIETDHCGTCTACIDACPTNAILANKVIDAGKCISHATIELKDTIPADIAQKSQDWIFGCDICQDVCPWNRFSAPHKEERFIASNNWLDWDRDVWLNLTEEKFQQTFQNSAIQRAGYHKLSETIKLVTKHKD